MKVMSQKHLSRTLSKLSPFKKPNMMLEQYTTNCDVAAELLWSMSMRGLIKNKSVLDLGAGTGLLGIGALLLGARKVTFLEKDVHAVEILKENLKRVSSEYELGHYQIINDDVSNVSDQHDVTIMNPPFGTKIKRIDTIFLEKAFDLSRYVLTIHKTSTKDYIKNVFFDNDFELLDVFDFEYKLKKTLLRHEKLVKTIFVTAFLGRKKQKEEACEQLKKITKKRNVLFMDKCRDAAELIMIYAKDKGYFDVVLQEEGGWYTYEKSAVKTGLNVLKASMIQGKLIQEKFPKQKALVIINTNPGYAYVEELSFYDDIKKTGSIIVNDVVSSIGEDYATKGDFIIGSFGKHKPLSISTGGAFIAFDDEFDDIKKVKKELMPSQGEKINFQELRNAIKNFNNKKKAWFDYSNKIKQELSNKGFKILNNEQSINILVKVNASERENLIKLCDDLKLEYLLCPRYIRTLEDAISIEIKKKNQEDL